MSEKTMDNLSLVFLNNDAGEQEGLHDAGIETFRGSPFPSCAREAGQNSKDAAAGSDHPVRLTFDLHMIAREKIPSIDKLEETIELCYGQSNDDNEKAFFEKALETIKKDKIPVLEISDFNTKGLIGPPEKPRTPFHALLKAKGITSKDVYGGKTPGGSFGIGKNASFAVSALRTVFYSTRYIDPDSGLESCAAQGKATLISHSEKDGTPKRAVGYWGYPQGFSAVTNEDKIPDWMRRKEIGASIFCTGFLGDGASWKELMICSLICNFFSAIQKGEIEFSVGDKTINAGSIESLLFDKDLPPRISETALLDELKFAQFLYRSMTSDLSTTDTVALLQGERFLVRVMADMGMPRRVGFVRNGMYITDNLAQFGERFQRFPGAKDFVCLVEPENESANRLLKSLENPEHRDFSPDRIDDPVKQKQAIKSMQMLGSEIRTLIKKKAGTELKDSVVLDELAHLFSQPTGNEKEEDDSEKDPEKYTYNVIREDEGASSKSGREKNQGTGNHSRGSNGGKGNNGTSNNGNKSGGQKTSVSRNIVNLESVRNTFPNRSSLGSRKIHFTPLQSGLIEIKVRALGINQSEDLVILDASPMALKNGVLIVDAVKGKREEIILTFDRDYSGPIELTASELA